MAFATEITIPANTTSNDPTIVTLSGTSMRVVGLDITFPDGCVGLVECSIDYQGRQLFPYNPEGRFVGNGQTISIHPQIDLIGPPHEISIVGVNADDTFEHTLYIVIDVLFLDKQGNVDTAMLDALRELFAMPGR